MEVNRCPYCMEEMGQNTVCPYCHKDSMTVEDSAFALPHNTILYGKYLIGAVLGQGGFGITYIGFDLSLEMKVAIKEYYPQNIASRENKTVVFHSTSLDEKNQWAIGKEQFLSEARKMAKMNNIQSIVSVRETFYENDTAYIVMDYVSGITLKQFLQKNGTLTFKECVQMMLPIIDDLDKAHAAGMIHRDISPDNMMLGPDGKMYLLDMGAAKDLRKRDDQNVHVVKMGFSPLEQFQGDEEIGPWSDIYSLCVTIYYAVFGKIVPTALDRIEKECLSFEGGRKPLSKMQTETLEKGLALHKETRIQSAAQLANMLRKCIGEKRLPSVNKKLAAIISGAAAAAAVVVGTVVMAPWEPKVEEFGCPNTNVYQESDYHYIEGQYEYYMDTDWNLYVVPYNEEDQTFYIDEGAVVDDEAGSINVGKTKAYFIHDQHDEDGDHDSILQMDFDGGNIETLVEQDGLSLMQYVRLSNGKEYLYYTSKTDEDLSYELYRYNIETGKTDLVKDDILWFNMEGKYLYYVTLDGQNPYDYSALHRSFLDGGRDKILDDKHCLIHGYVVDGNIYMASLKQEIMVQVDESEKNKVETVGGNYSSDIASGTSVYGDGWFYYCSDGSTEIDRVMADGTGKSVVAEVGQNVLRLNYFNSWLLVVEGEYNAEKEEYQLSSSSLISYDGSKSMSLGTPNKDGLTYTIVDGEAYITGYTGEESHVAVPMSINGYPLNFSNRYLDDSLNDVIFHLEIPEDELTYDKADGGICITGYNPNQTKDQYFLAVPSEIDGQPVIEIGENAFSNEDKEEDERYTFGEMLLPDTVQIIDMYAFYKCDSLEYINMPSDLKQLKKMAFVFCPLTDLEIVFPEGMQSIGAMVFANAKLKSVYLPDSLEIVGDNPFVGCGQDSEDAGELFLIDDNSTAFCVEGGVLYNADKTTLYTVQAHVNDFLTIPNTVAEIRSAAFANTNCVLVTVPASVTDYDMAFWMSNIMQVKLKEGITEIPEGAFYSCGHLRLIAIPDTVKTIGSKAFKGCENLGSVTISADCVAEDDAFDSNTSVVRE